MCLFLNKTTHCTLFIFLLIVSLKTMQQSRVKDSTVALASKPDLLRTHCPAVSASPRAALPSLADYCQAGFAGLLGLLAFRISVDFTWSLDLSTGWPFCIAAPISISVCTVRGSQELPLPSQMCLRQQHKLPRLQITIHEMSIYGHTHSDSQDSRTLNAGKVSVKTQIFSFLIFLIVKPKPLSPKLS